jgi:hypothetical protein
VQPNSRMPPMPRQGAPSRVARRGPTRDAVAGCLLPLHRFVRGGAPSLGPLSPPRSAAELGGSVTGAGTAPGRGRGAVLPTSRSTATVQKRREARSWPQGPRHRRAVRRRTQPRRRLGRVPTASFDGMTVEHRQGEYSRSRLLARPIVGIVDAMPARHIQLGGTWILDHSSLAPGQWGKMVRGHTTRVVR